MLIKSQLESLGNITEALNIEALQNGSSLYTVSFWENETTMQGRFSNELVKRIHSKFNVTESVINADSGYLHIYFTDTYNEVNYKITLT